MNYVEMQFWFISTKNEFWKKMVFPEILRSDQFSGSPYISCYFLLVFQMKEFIASKIKDQGSARRLILQAQEKIQAKIAWIQRNEKTIEKCLHKLLNPLF